MNTEQQLFVIQVSGGRFGIAWADHATAPPQIEPRIRPHRFWHVAESRCREVFGITPQAYGVTH